jgi:hypothetical protein
MSEQKLTKILNTKNFAESSMALNKMLGQKAFQALKQNFSSFKKVYEKKLKEATAYDSIVDFAENAPEDSGYPLHDTLHIRFKDGSEMDIPKAEAMKLVKGVRKCTDPVLKYQLVALIRLSADGLAKAKKYLEKQ